MSSERSRYPPQACFHWVALLRNRGHLLWRGAPMESPTGHLPQERQLQPTFGMPHGKYSISIEVLWNAAAIEKAAATLQEPCEADRPAHRWQASRGARRPAPVPDPSEVLVRRVVSVISPGSPTSSPSRRRDCLLRRWPSLIWSARYGPPGWPPSGMQCRAESPANCRWAAGIVVEAGPAARMCRSATGDAGKANHAQRQCLACSARRSGSFTGIPMGGHSQCE